MHDLPFRLKGEVVKGFGRGGKELGIPTANFSDYVVDNCLPKSIQQGIYFGWASLNGKRPPLKMVTSVGWNPFYQNTKRSIETHILQHFEEDFYGEELRIVCVGYIRDEADFESVACYSKLLNPYCRPK
ncbi:riboflavin kinase-like isoform X2 [Zophobas morio]|uniref:riboflavin kinase-like isoform X2 n=1 Tax=Zophobas morio TaxID=2755281 RepID=UPI003083754D